LRGALQLAKTCTKLLSILFDECDAVVPPNEVETPSVSLSWQTRTAPKGWQTAALWDKKKQKPTSVSLSWCRREFMPKGKAFPREICPSYRGVGNVSQPIVAETRICSCPRDGKRLSCEAKIQNHLKRSVGCVKHGSS